MVVPTSSVYSHASYFSPFQKVVFVSPTSEPMLQKWEFRVCLASLYQFTPSKHTCKHSMSIGPPGRRDQDETRINILKERQRGDEGGENILIQVWNLEEKRCSSETSGPANGEPQSKGNLTEMGQVSSPCCAGIGWMQSRKNMAEARIHMWHFPNFVWHNIFTLHFNSLQCGFAPFPSNVHTHTHIYTYIYI